ncbi:MAG: hypothetical protein ACPGVT_05980 [Maricaulaceae bacterium]
MGNQILSEKIENYPNGIKIVRHNLPETNLFTQAALAKAIEEHPPELMDICVEGSFSTCERNGFTGMQLIEAVKQGKFWINLKQIERVDSPIGNLVKKMHSEVEHTMGRKTRSKIGGLLISSPSATVGYHFDLTDVTLHHIHGRKRIYIYPNKAPFLNSENVEDIALAEGVEKLPYNVKFDVAADVFDLEPGHMISWPHLSPHRVDNLSDLNVSISLESMCFESRLAVGAHFFDGFTYKRFGTRFFPQSENKFIRFMKSSIAICIKKSGMLNRAEAPTNYT